MAQKQDRIPALDGLRVGMIFIVSWYHIWQQSWLRPEIGGYSLDYLVRSGYIWVDGTVLLSVFLLFLPYARAMFGERVLPDTKDFYRRRAKRVLPGYYFIIFTVLLAVALPWRLYDRNGALDGPYLVKDLVTHLTFTFPFFYDTYVATPLGAASWTLAILVQGYVLFPLLARGTVKKPALTLGVMAGVTLGFRAWCLWALDDYTMVVNQLLNFLDVYVIGMLTAIAYVRLETFFGKERAKNKRLLTEAAAAAVFIGVLIALLQLLRYQASSSGYPEIQRRQMIYRPAYALCFALLVLSAPFSLAPLRLLLGNRVTRFLGAVSMNYYLIHQTVIVHMKRIGFPHAETDMPWYGESRWQITYTLLAFGISFALAVAITYGVEKPVGRLIDKRRQRKEK